MSDVGSTPKLLGAPLTPASTAYTITEAEDAAASAAVSAAVSADVAMAQAMALTTTNTDAETTAVAKTLDKAAAAINSASEQLEAVCADGACDTGRVEAMRLEKDIVIAQQSKVASVKQELQETKENGDTEEIEEATIAYQNELKRLALANFAFNNAVQQAARKSSLSGSSSSSNTSTIVAVVLGVALLLVFAVLLPAVKFWWTG